MVVCYFRSGHSNFLPSDVDPCLCTHLVFSSIVVTEDGVENARGESSQLKSLVALKKENPLLSVMAAVVGTESALSGPNAANIAFLADVLAGFIRENEIDGIDIWWNYQNVDVKQSEKYLRHSSDLLTNFTKSLRSEMQKIFPTDPILSLTLAKDVHFLLNGYDFSSITNGVDLFNFPAFQFTKSKSHIAEHPSRLQGAADMDNVDSFVDLMISLGIPRTKIIIGVPIFGAAYLLVDPQKSSTGSPTQELNMAHGVSSYPQILSYPQICNMITAGNWDIHRDVDDGSPYASRGVHWIGFEDRTSIKTKTKYVLLRNLGGVSMWTVNDDDHRNVCRQGTLPLLRSAHDMLLALKSPLDSFHDTDVTLESDESQQDLKIVEREGLIQRLDSRNTDPQTLMRFQCSRSGYFRDPKDCTKFYRCAKYGGKANSESVVFLYDCPHGLVFDEKDELCNWPPWSPPCEGSGEVMPVPQRTFTCPSTGYYQDPENCRWFFYCADFGDGQTKAFEFRCPSALLGFDQEKVMCNWKWLVSGCPGVSLDRVEAIRTAEQRAGLFPRKAVYVSKESMENEYHTSESVNREANSNEKKISGRGFGDRNTDFIISSGLWDRKNFDPNDFHNHRPPDVFVPVTFMSGTELNIMPTSRQKEREFQYGDMQYDENFDYTYSSHSSKVTSHTYKDHHRRISPSSDLFPTKVKSDVTFHNGYLPANNGEMPLIIHGGTNQRSYPFSNRSSAEGKDESIHLKLERQEMWTKSQTSVDAKEFYRETNYSSEDKPYLERIDIGAAPQQFSKGAGNNPALPQARGEKPQTTPLSRDWKSQNDDGSVSPHKTFGFGRNQETDHILNVNEFSRGTMNYNSERNPYFAATDVGTAPLRLNRREGTDRVLPHAGKEVPQTARYVSSDWGLENDGEFTSTNETTDFGKKQELTGQMLNNTNTLDRIHSESNINQVIDRKGIVFKRSQGQKPLQREEDTWFQYVPSGLTSSAGQDLKSSEPTKSHNTVEHSGNGPFEMVLEAVLSLSNEENRGDVNNKKLNGLVGRRIDNKIANRMSSLSSPLSEKNKNPQKLDSEKDHLQCVSEVSLVISGKGERGNFPEKWILKKSQLKRLGPDSEVKSVVPERNDESSKFRVSERNNDARISIDENYGKAGLSHQNRQPVYQSSVQYSDESDDISTKEHTFSFINSTYIGDFSLPPRLQPGTKLETVPSDEDGVEKPRNSSSLTSSNVHSEEQGKTSSASSRRATAVNSEEEVYDKVLRKIPEHEVTSKNTSQVSSLNTHLLHDRLSLSQAQDDKRDRGSLSISLGNENSTHENMNSSFHKKPEFREENYASNVSGDPSIVTPYSSVGKESSIRNSEIVRTVTLGIVPNVRPVTNVKEILHLSGERDKFNLNTQSRETVSGTSSFPAEKPSLNNALSGILLEVESPKVRHPHQDVLYEVYERKINPGSDNILKGNQLQRNSTVLTQKENKAYSQGQARKVPTGSTASVVFDQTPMTEAVKLPTHLGQSGKSTSSPILTDRNVAAELEIKLVSSNFRNRQPSLASAGQGGKVNNSSSGFSLNQERKELQPASVITSNDTTLKELSRKNITSHLRRDGDHTADARVLQKSGDSRKTEQPLLNSSGQIISSHGNNSETKSFTVTNRTPNERQSQRKFIEGTEISHDDEISNLPKKLAGNQTLRSNIPPINPTDPDLSLGELQGHLRGLSGEGNIRFGERLRPLTYTAVNRNKLQMPNGRNLSQKPAPLTGQHDPNGYHSLPNEPKQSARHDPIRRVTLSLNLPKEYERRTPQSNAETANIRNDYDPTILSRGQRHYHRNTAVLGSENTTNAVETDLRRYVSNENENQGRQRIRNLSRRRNSTQILASPNESTNNRLENNGNFYRRTKAAPQAVFPVDYTLERKYVSEALSSDDISAARVSEVDRHDAKGIMDTFTTNISASNKDLAKTAEGNSLSPAFQSSYSELQRGGILDQTFTSPLKRYIFPISPNAFRYPQRNDLYVTSKRNASQTTLTRRVIDVSDQHRDHNQGTHVSNTLTGTPGVPLILNSLSPGVRPTSGSPVSLSREPRVLNSLSADGRNAQVHSSRSNSGALGENLTRAQYLRSDRTQSRHVQFDYSDGDKLNTYLRIGTFLIFPSDEYDEGDPRNFHSSARNNAAPRTVSRSEESHVPSGRSASGNITSSTTDANFNTNVPIADKRDESFGLGKNDLDEKVKVSDDKTITSTNIPGVACTRAGLFYHPDDCNKFYQCYWDRWLQKFTLHVFKCPVKLVFDDRIFGCSYPEWEAPCLSSAKSENNES